jgi:hypothetical protein
MAASPPPWRAARGARRAGSIWRVSESFPELAQAVLEHAQPGRIDVVRAKRHLLGQISGGQPHPSGTLIASVAALLGAEPLGRLQIDLPSRASVKAVVTADHPIPAAIRADLSAREALAELAADGMLIAAGTGPIAGSDEMMLSFQLPGYSAGQRLRLHRPAVLSDVVQLPHRLRQQGLWGLEPDIFIADLASLRLDPRTERSLREAIESYRRGVFLAASSLLGAAVEGAWYAAGQRQAACRGHSPSSPGLGADQRGQAARSDCEPSPAGSACQAGRPTMTSGHQSLGPAAPAMLKRQGRPYGLPGGAGG